MISLLAALQQRQGESWLLGIDSEEWWEECQRAIATLTTEKLTHPTPQILLIPSNLLHYLAQLIAALVTECPVFLGNPQWSVAEWDQVLAIAQPDVVWGEAANLPPRKAPTVRLNQAQPGWIMIPTGGSSGQIKFAIHTWSTLSAAIQGCQTYLQPEQGAINSCCLLPLYHVSGLMQFLRSLLTGGQFALAPDRTLDALLACPEFQPQRFFLSLVPTQLQRLLSQPEQARILPQFQAILLGGAPASPALLAMARSQNLRLVLSYGMTETAALVTALPAADFLAGQQNAGQVLPHAKIQICDRKGNPLPTGQTGQVVIQAKSLTLGYLGQPPLQQCLLTDDLGYLDEQGYLHLVGRHSRKLISGGENVFPEEVEAAILATGLVQDVYVLGLPDPEWGEVVAAVYVPRDAGMTQAQLKQAIAPYLSRYKQPKHWLAVSHLPRNPQGKINHPQIQHWFG